MSWLYSRGLVEEFSEGISLDGAQSALWNGTPTQPPSWCNDRTMAACRLSRSGTTFRPLTDDLGEAVLMSFLEAFPVRTSAPLEKEQESTERDPVCGSTWRELSMRCVREKGCSSRIVQCLLWAEDLEPSSVTLPKWGMMRNGECWERITLPPLTSATLRHCDCRTPLRDIATLVVREQQLAAAGRVGAMARVEVASTDEASIGGFMEQWAQLYGALSDVGFMFMSDIGRL